MWNHKVWGKFSLNFQELVTDTYVLYFYFMKVNYKNLSHAKTKDDNLFFFQEYLTQNKKKYIKVHTGNLKYYGSSWVFYERKVKNIAIQILFGIR